MGPAANFNSPQNEDSLIVQAQAGSHLAINALLGHYQGYLMRYAMSLLPDPDAADDIVQESFIKAFRAIQQYCGEGSFRGWLRSIVRNTWKNYLRSEHAERYNYTIDVYSADVVDEMSIEQSVIHQQEVLCIQRAIESLPAKQRIAVDLRINKQMPFAKIAEKVKSPVSTVKSSHYTGIRFIQDMLANVLNPY